MVGLAIRLQEIGDAELEEFVEQWLDRKAGKFANVLRIGAANDKGRDVIGFLSDRRHEGPWELYQCKRKTRDKKVGVPEAMGELGKVFYHYVKGAYATLPTAYFFVAPRGIVGTLQDLLLNPSKIGPYLISHWDQYCAEYITSTQVPLTPEIRTAIEAAAFSRFHRDNTAPGAVGVFRDDVYHSVFEAYSQTHASRLKRVETVMQHAGAAPIGLLGRLTRVPVRQGMCHHLVNEGRLKWMP